MTGKQPEPQSLTWPPPLYVWIALGALIVSAIAFGMELAIHLR